MPQQRFTTTDLREFWCHYACEGSEYGDLGSACGAPGEWADPDFYGMPIGGVPLVALDPYYALERALMSEGYQARSVWAYNCRPIASSGKLSLHGMGIAIDIDPSENPQAHVPPFSGKFTEAQVDAVMGIRLSNGEPPWWWGGYWSGSTTPDLMHWQLDCTPAEAVTIDWTTVPGGGDDVAKWKSRDGYTYETDDWANHEDNIKWVINEGLMVGTRNESKKTGDFKATDALARREFATVLRRFAKDAAVADDIEKD